MWNWRQVEVELLAGGRMTAKDISIKNKFKLINKTFV
jgi:hypothetical protein